MLTRTNLCSRSALLLLCLAFSALLASQWHSALVLARPEAKEGLSVEQLVELAESQSGEDEEVRYGLAETDSENEQKQERPVQNARDTFLALEPEDGGSNGRDSDAERRQIWRARHREQRRRHRNGAAHRQQQGQGQGHGTTMGENSGEEGEPRLRDGQSLLTLTSADVVNATLQSNNCRGDLFKHRIKVVGCRPKTVTNRFCHGSCSSFYIPRLRSNKKLKATFQSYAACVPSETDLIQIRLDCPEREPRVLYRSIVRVKKCACRNIMVGGEPEQNIDGAGDEQAEDGAGEEPIAAKGAGDDQQRD